MKKILLLVVICFLSGGLFTVSCSKAKPEYPFSQMTKIEAFNFIYNTNKIKCMYGPEMTSNPYCIPTVAWIREVYAPYLANFLQKNALDKAVDPENNCVKFSTYGCAVGHMLHFLNKEGPAKTSLAIGIVDYHPSMDSGHSLNFFIARDETNNLVIVYFEPQTQKIVSDKDIYSDWIMVRM